MDFSLDTKNNDKTIDDYNNLNLVVMRRSAYSTSFYNNEMTAWSK